MYKRLAISIVIVFLMISCNEEHREIRKLNNLLNQEYKYKIKKVSFIIIIPQSGCHGCISESIKFIRANLNKTSDFFVILSKITDEKYFSFYTGSEIFNNKNVYFDEGNEISRITKMTIYPQIVFIKNGKAKSIMDVSPNERNIWKKLSRDIQKKVRSICH